MLVCKLLAAVAFAVAIAERTDRSEAVVLAAGREVQAEKNGTATEVQAEKSGSVGDVSAFPYANIGDYLGDDSKGLVQEADTFAAHVNGELTAKAGEAGQKAEEYARLLKQQDAGTDLVLANVHNFKTHLTEHEKENLKRVVSELNQAVDGTGGTGGKGADVAPQEMKFEEVPPTPEMMTRGVEDFMATQIGLKAIHFMEGTGQLDQETQDNIESAFVEPLREAKGKAPPDSHFYFCIYYSTTAGADTVLPGLMEKRGTTLREIVETHAGTILKGVEWKIGDDHPDYDSTRLGAIVFKTLAKGKEGECSPMDGKVAESGSAA